tara:strand:+ start:826 stop:2028 length:1203 start_codon:yes stop_codon:yes gene_type:complete
MDKQILKKLLEYDFYINSKGIVLRDFFSSNLALIYDTIIRSHDKYSSDLKMEWVKALHFEHNALTDANKAVVVTIFDSIEGEDVVPDAIALDIIKSMSVRACAQKTINTAMKIINGQTHTLDELTGVLSGLQSEAEISSTAKRVKFDLTDLLDGVSEDNLFKFRLPCLHEKVYGAGRGNFIISFARPEAGKTTHAVYEACGYLMQGLRVAYFANEEPAFRTYLRMVCSMYELSVGDIRKDVEKYSANFKRDYADNLFMHDCVGMSIEEVNTWCMNNKPDVVIFDQLDKFGINGTFSRGDEKLGALYTSAREIAKRNDCLSWAVSQCSADGDGLAAIDFSMLAGAKTSKAAEGDIVIGIGSTSHLQENNKYRQFNVSKNKINGWHGSVTAELEAEKAIFTA